MADIDKSNTWAESVNDGSRLKEKFPEKDWHRHWRGQSGKTQWCDGTPSDCKTKERL